MEAAKEALEAVQDQKAVVEEAKADLEAIQEADAQEADTQKVDVQALEAKTVLKNNDDTAKINYFHCSVQCANLLSVNKSSSSLNLIKHCVISTISIIAFHCQVLKSFSKNLPRHFNLQYVFKKEIM